MKTITTLTLFALFILFSSGCCKEEMDSGNTTTKTVNVDMAANDTYTSAVPHAGDADDVMQITRQAAHFTSSQVNPSTNGNVVFEYKPAQNFTGTDEVQISNVEGSHGTNPHGNCGGKHHHDETTTTIFKITIRPSASK
jgi:hypothetical protein